MKKIRLDIRELLDRIRAWWSKESCYNRMEATGTAAFGMCSGMVSGDSFTDNLSYSCIDCEHFTFVKGENK